jgi:hypothetical protein
MPDKKAQAARDGVVAGLSASAGWGVLAGGGGRAGYPFGPISPSPVWRRLLLNLIPRPSSWPRHKAGRGVWGHQQRTAGRADQGRRGRAPDPKLARPHRPTGGERMPVDGGRGGGAPDARGGGT